MVKFVTIDLVGLLAGGCTIWFVLSQWAKGRRKISRVDAYFTAGVGGNGPLDGQHREILPGNTFIYEEGEIPVVYKHTGSNIYEYAGPVSKRDR